MMDFTISNPLVAGESAGNDFVISSVVDPLRRHASSTWRTFPEHHAKERRCSRRACRRGRKLGADRLTA
jgi:hypothetical protein